MLKYLLYLLVLFQILPLLGCSKIQDQSKEIDNKSYINDFELSQKNSINDTIVKISSPRAIIDPNSNDIEIFDNVIKILNNNEQDVIIKSGNSTLSNSTNLIKVFNNVNISLQDNKNYYLNTDNFSWNLNSSIINLSSPLNINFGNTTIISSDGIYNINSNLLKINNNIFKRSVFNSEGKEKYQIEISSDIASWKKKDNTLEFTSNNHQVETTIYFLSIK